MWETLGQPESSTRSGFVKRLRPGDGDGPVRKPTRPQPAKELSDGFRFARAWIADRFPGPGTHLAMKRIIRTEPVSEEQYKKDTEVRRLVEAELPELIQRHHERMEKSLPEGEAPQGGNITQVRNGLPI